MQVERDILGGVVEFRTMTHLKLWMWTQILIQMLTPFEFDMIEEFQEIKKFPDLFLVASCSFTIYRAQARG